MKNRKTTCTLYVNKGKRYLQQHKPGKAVVQFKQALKSCAIKNTQKTVKILQYLGIALNQLGLRNSAIKSFLSARRLHKTRRMQNRVLRHSNDYGMALTGLEELDDWNAFYSIQLKRYLSQRGRGQFGSGAEEDMVKHLIYDEWIILKQSVIIENLPVEEKLALFMRQKIIFPFLSVSTEDVSREIHVNFRTKTRLNQSSRCSCGSGLPFGLCCGRTPGIEELKFGCF